MSSPPIEAVARETFGFEALRPGQRLAIESVLDGRDTLVVMSTGSGKSAIYEIAGVIKPGVTVVISRLNALRRARIEAIERSTAGTLEHVFLAPEMLGDAEVLGQVREAAPALIVVDHAHRICEQDEDFQPDYLRLGAFVAEMGHPTVLALSAIASPPAREEIIEKLHMHDPVVVAPGEERAAEAEE